MPRVIETVTHTKPQPEYKSAEEVQDLCCGTGSAIQCAVKVEKNWDGYSTQEALDKLGITLDEQGRDSSGRYINVEFAPRSQPCGETKTKYDVSGENCCELVEPLGFNSQESASILADMTAGVVVITGGRPPFNVSVRGDGFFIDSARQHHNGITYGRTVTVFTGYACGTGHVTVSDGCSSASMSIRSPDGTWEMVYQNNSGGAIGFGGCPVEFSGDGGEALGAGRFEGIQGEWKIEQTYVTNAANVVAARRPYSGQSIIANYKNAVDTCAEYESVRYPPGITEDRVTGACWRWDFRCMGCLNDCAEVGDSSLFSYDPGFHAAISRDCTQDAGWCWVVTGWSLVISTTIYKWTC